jgi:hypothetical protein
MAVEVSQSHVDLLLDFWAKRIAMTRDDLDDPRAISTIYARRLPAQVPLELTSAYHRLF